MIKMARNMPQMNKLDQRGIKLIILKIHKDDDDDDILEYIQNLKIINFILLKGF